jgi:glycerol-3-phosphate acyltransferase PlsY
MFDFLELSIWGVLFAILAGYLIGSIPSGVIFSRLFGGPDPRRTGSGHTGATNILRNINLAAGVLTGLLDLSKGALAVWLVQQIFPSPWVVPLAGVAAVAGHCWPVFADFRGGMGIATAAGLALWQFPLALPIYAIAYFAVNYFIRHQARTIMLISAFLPLMILPFTTSPEKITLASGIAIVLIIRWASDFNRVYE